MALATTVTGDGILVSSETNKQKLVLFTDTGTFLFLKTITESVREWVALTQSAAQTAAETATQPENGVATYDALEDNRIVGSYKLVKTTTVTTIEDVTP
jgi:hypothetical protein